MTKTPTGSEDSKKDRIEKRNQKIREKYADYQAKKTPSGKQELSHARIMDYLMNEDIVGALSRDYVEKIIWERE